MPETTSNTLFARFIEKGNALNEHRIVYVTANAKQQFIAFHIGPIIVPRKMCAEFLQAFLLVVVGINNIHSDVSFDSRFSYPFYLVASISSTGSNRRLRSIGTSRRDSRSTFSRNEIVFCDDSTLPNGAGVLCCRVQPSSDDKSSTISLYLYVVGSDILSIKPD